VVYRRVELITFTGLEQRGLIITRHGRGTFITPGR
jgi:hypothetical protein